ncbi:MAG: hypothetical protein RR415_06580 [Ruthenibacterium sp.]
MREKIKRMLCCKKVKGNVDNIVISMCFITVLLVVLVLNFRLAMLNQVYIYMDDSLTSSLLGGLMIDSTDYRKSHQTVIHKPDVIEEVPYSEKEAVILMAEAYLEKSAVLSYDDLPKKQIKAPTSGGCSELGDRRSEANKDKFVKLSHHAFVSNMRYNLSNGNLTHNYTGVDEPNLPTVNENNLILSKDEVKNSFIKSFISSAIEVKEFIIYNFYKETTKDTHTLTREMLQKIYDENKIHYMYLAGYYLGNKKAPISDWPLPLSFEEDSLIVKGEHKATPTEMVVEYKCLKNTSGEGYNVTSRAITGDAIKTLKAPNDVPVTDTSVYATIDFSMGLKKVVIDENEMKDADKIMGVPVKNITKNVSISRLMTLDVLPKST